MKWRQIRLSGEYQRWTSLNCYERLIVTSGGHYRAASLLFAHSMLRETTLHERAPPRLDICRPSRFSQNARSSFDRGRFRGCRSFHNWLAHGVQESLPSARLVFAQDQLGQGCCEDSKAASGYLRIASALAGSPCRRSLAHNSREARGDPNRGDPLPRSNGRAQNTSPTIVITRDTRRLPASAPCGAI